MPQIKEQPIPISVFCLITWVFMLAGAGACTSETVPTGIENFDYRWNPTANFVVNGVDNAPGSGGSRFSYNTHRDLPLGFFSGIVTESLSTLQEQDGTVASWLFAGKITSYGGGFGDQDLLCQGEG